MKTTTNYGFKQPEGTDIVNIDDISDNFGSVDTEIKKANDKVVSHEGKGGTVHADVTITTSGFMSASDKTKLNGIATGAQTNQNAVQSIQVVTPTGTVVGTATAASTTDTIQLKEGNNIDIAVSGKVVTVNNTYSYTHPTGDGNLHVPATGTTNSGKVLKAGATAGSLSWGTLTHTDVGALPTSHEGQGGSVHAEATTSAAGFMSAADKTKLNGIAAGANKVESSTTNGNIKVNGTETNVYTHPTGTNPHGATKADIGLSNVTNDSQVKRSEMGVANGVSTLDANGVNKQPPISHASTGTSYGVADTSNYGHVKVGNGIAASSGTISVDVGDGVVLSGNSPNQKLVADVGTGLTLEGTSPNKKIALANSGVTVGAYGKVTVDAKGRVTSGGDLSASDIPNLPWNKITSGKPTTLDGYGITDALKKDVPLENFPLDYKFFDANNPGRYGANFNNSDIFGVNALVFNDYFGNTVDEGIFFPKSDSVPIGSNSRDDYDRLSVQNGEITLNQVGIQQCRLTAIDGSCISSVSNFNNMINSGAYAVSSASSITGAPYTGAIYGTLWVQKRNSNNTIQFFMSASTNPVILFRMNDGSSWGGWKQSASFNDFQGLNSANGYQRLPNGLIIQWGVATGKTNSSTITYPISMNSCYAVLATPRNNGYSTTCTVNYFGVDNFYVYCPGSVDISWIAIGRLG